MKVWKVFLVMIVFGLSFAGTQKKKSQPQDIYHARCVDNAKKDRSLDEAQKICNCAVKSMKMTADGFRLLNEPAQTLSKEESLRIENIDDERQITENFEIDVLLMCIDKIQSEKSQRRQQSMGDSQ